MAARRGLEKARRGLKVQRGPNFKFDFGPRLALDHVEFMHNVGHRVMTVHLIMTEIELHLVIMEHQNTTKC